MAVYKFHFFSWHDSWSPRNNLHTRLVLLTKFLSPLAMGERCEKCLHCVNNCYGNFHSPSKFGVAACHRHSCHYRADGFLSDRNRAYVMLLRTRETVIEWFNIWIWLFDRAHGLSSSEYWLNTDKNLALIWLSMVASTRQLQNLSNNVQFMRSLRICKLLKSFSLILLAVSLLFCSSFHLLLIFMGLFKQSNSIKVNMGENAIYGIIFFYQVNHSIFHRQWKMRLSHPVSCVYLVLKVHYRCAPTGKNNLLHKSKKKQNKKINRVLNKILSP